MPAVNDWFQDLGESSHMTLEGGVPPKNAYQAVIAIIISTDEAKWCGCPHHSIEELS